MRGTSIVASLWLLGRSQAALRDAFRDVLPFPGHASRGAFSDRGAWHGFALPDTGSAGGFAGPFIQGTWLPGNHWLSPGSLVQFIPAVSRSSSQLAVRLQQMAPTGVTASYVPGALRQEYRVGPLKVTSELAFVGRRTAAARVLVENAESMPASLRLAFNGTASVPLRLQAGAVLASNISARAAEAATVVRFQPSQELELRAVGSGYLAVAPEARDLAPSERFVTYYTVALSLNASEIHVARQEAEAFFETPEQYFAEAEKRWEGYLHSILGDGGVGPAGPSLSQRVAVKAVSTLVLNWRSATGPTLLHDGCMPSITGFSNGLWSWDSWKHAAGLALFDPALAVSQVRAMFDHQGNQSGVAFVGMVPDKVALPPDVGDAWGNTKPPLAAWAAAQAHTRSGDTAFLREIFPMLERYHRWWYQWRDHDRNGLCEFGSSGNNTMEMKWESGMDNAPRFDDVSMLKNGDRAWSADQESVDLNSFLYLEKRVLADLATQLGNTSAARAYQAGADRLRQLAQERFFDEQRGYFFDRRLGATGTFVGPMGCEGFAPLWAGLASGAQAARVRRHLLDPAKFRTKVPFPCVAADAPQFRADGYWRGPVWLDQAYFAIDGLRRYGYASDSEAVFSELLSGAEGLGAGNPAAPFTENYNPHTGARQGAEWFGWSAAHLLLLLRVRDHDRELQHAAA